MTCPVCAGGTVEIYLNGRAEAITPAMVGSSRTDVDAGRILRCRSCRFGFREFRPSDAELARLYQQLDTHVYDAESAGRSRTAALHLRIVSRYVARPGRILDIGCASGLFLDCARKARWEVVGIEPSEVLAAEARDRLGPDAAILCATLQATDLPAASFDVITLWDLLEHVADPGVFLRLCTRLLKPGAHLVVNVPDLHSIQSRILGSRWPLLLAEHLNYFTVDSLRLCGENAGLQWLGYRRRPVAFSVDYVLYRMAQHRIPGSMTAQKLARFIGLKNRLAWLYLGEICGVWTRVDASA